MADELNSLEPQPEAVTSVDTLATELKKLQVWRGNPSLRQLAEMADKNTGANSLPKSTASDILAGKRLPKYEMYKNLLLALGVQKEEMERWFHAWRTAAHEHKGIVQSVPRQPALANRSHLDAGKLPTDEDLAIMPIAQAATALDAMSPQRARAAIASMPPQVAASRMNLMERHHVASVLEQMDEVRAGDLLDRMSCSGEVLGLMTPAAATERFQRTNPMHRKDLFARIDPTASVQMLLALDFAAALGLLMSLEARAAARCLEVMEIPEATVYLGHNAQRSAAWLSQAVPTMAARWLLQMETATAAHLVALLAPEPFVRLFEQLTAQEAAIIVSKMDFARAGELLASLGVNKLEELVDVLPGHSARQMIENMRQKIPTAELKRLLARHQQRHSG